MPGSSGKTSCCSDLAGTVLESEGTHRVCSRPTNTSPAAAHCSANCAFSLRKPYPGWMACGPPRSGYRDDQSGPIQITPGLPRRPDANGLVGFPHV